MVKQYVVEIETCERDAAVADRWVDDLSSWHGVVETGPTGNLVIVVTLPAEDLAQAVATGMRIVKPLAAHVSVRAQSEAVRDERAGWPQVPKLVSVADAADRLGVSRQRVLQLIDAGRLPATRVGKVWAVPAAALSRAADPQRTAGRP